MNNLQNEEIRKAVRQTYGDIAKSDSAGCGCGPSSCCGPGDMATADNISFGVGYAKDEITKAPEGSNMGLGCGNPQAIASLKPGETVLDLGSGGGFDCFLAAKAVGEEGFVIGVDMTPEMITKARVNAAKADFKNVDFRLGEIENLPVADETVDVIMSNCVINLSPEKKNVFQEAFRVLAPGGRLAITDIVAKVPLPEEIQNDLALHAGCVAGASLIKDLEAALNEAGFTKIRIKPIEKSKEFIRSSTPGSNIEDYIVSATIEAVKP
jgi:SAM-dependent methyltransferase